MTFAVHRRSSIGGGTSQKIPIADLFAIAEEDSRVRHVMRHQGIGFLACVCVDGQNDVDLFTMKLSKSHAVIQVVVAIVLTIVQT